MELLAGSDREAVLLDLGGVGSGCDQLERRLAIVPFRWGAGAGLDVGRQPDEPVAGVGLPEPVRAGGGEVAKPPLAPAQRFPRPSALDDPLQEQPATLAHEAQRQPHLLQQLLGQGGVVAKSRQAGDDLDLADEAALREGHAAGPRRRAPRHWSPAPTRRRGRPAQARLRARSAPAQGTGSRTGASPLSRMLPHLPPFRDQSCRGAGTARTIWMPFHL